MESGESSIKQYVNNYNVNSYYKGVLLWNDYANQKYLYGYFLR